MLKKYISCILFCFFLNSAFTNTAAFACFQNEDAHEKCKNITELFEDNLFGYFFEEGFITTSIPIGKIESKKNISLETIKSFFEEEPDYMIIFYMQYDKDLVFNKKTEAKEADWKELYVLVIDGINKKEIYTKTIDMTKFKESSPDKKAVKAASLISKEVFEAIDGARRDK